MSTRLMGDGGGFGKLGLCIGPTFFLPFTPGTQGSPKPPDRGLQIKDKGPTRGPQSMTHIRFFFGHPSAEQKTMYFLMKPCSAENHLCLWPPSQRIYFVCRNHSFSAEHVFFCGHPRRIYLIWRRSFSTETCFFAFGFCSLPFPQAYEAFFPGACCAIFCVNCVFPQNFLQAPC